MVMQHKNGIVQTPQSLQDETGESWYIIVHLKS